ncbi:hypothetical protein A3C23_02025 [Candidatus Roizmanbacteria bacterium RIFCSPHIGHO2_02_FULL_37_13b]|uniref:Uncharacterized protein n=1 Tax=Candidatus Roizmanbacteria bacterium RIFCSPLOWO2_02_FULL_36_11 TaxID=1802071 RepID=A0A1F7JBN9_9BACT|nr:MAG: hypothetical protein A3C23_02025 [Candidatus Roizmanbacteria bacterium RIFCSPHIGHO2_02_FULL_37_13b]OGK53027.1 MAG: hypothetical protein A3H78_02345 [Candidatus Roizmanbacteria bacterium RIFCSPLOWO2_02_FULL_36_11]
MTISVFGNSILKSDSLLISLLPQLKTQFPQHQFIHQDPTENLLIPKGEWSIIDVAEGINKVTIFDNLDHFVRTKSLTVHDYDLYLDLKLKQKVGQLPKIKIIAIPQFMKKKDVLEALGKII